MTIERLVLRADGSSEMGAGHVMRLLAIAEAMRARGGEAVFVLGGEPELLAGEVESRGIRCEQLAPDVAEDAQLALLADLCGDSAALVADGYHFSTEFFAGCQRIAPTAVIDDLADRPLPVAVVVNPNFGAEGLDYRPCTSAALHLGTRFALLRSEVLRQGREREKVAEGLRVVLSFGGSDPTGAALRLLPLLPGDARLVYRLIVGAGCASVDELRRVSARLRSEGLELELVHQPRDIGASLAWAHAALSAAGGTLWELAYLGIPTLAFSVVDNQRPVAEALRRRELVACGRELSALSDDEIRLELQRFTHEADRRAHLAKRFSQLVDGEGALRVLKTLDECNDRTRHEH